MVVLAMPHVSNRRDKDDFSLAASKQLAGGWAHCHINDHVLHCDTDFFFTKCTPPLNLESKDHVASNCKTHHDVFLHQQHQEKSEM